MVASAVAAAHTDICFIAVSVQVGRAFEPPGHEAARERQWGTRRVLASPTAPPGLSILAHSGKVRRLAEPAAAPRC
jgi:hypothetical protein